MNLILHPATKDALDRWLEHPGQASLIHGPEGIGKKSIALWLSEAILEDATRSQKLSAITVVKPSKNNTIPIEEIRSLRSSLRLKATTNKKIDRVVVILESELLSREASNALLKMLEEPPLGTTFIMTAPSTSSLLPTIVSRVQALRVRKPSQTVLTEYFIGLGYEPEEVTRALLLSENLPGLTRNLLEENTTHELTVTIQTAKRLIQAPVYERLLAINQLSRDVNLGVFLMANEKIAKTAMVQAVGNHKTDIARRWLQYLKRLEKIQSNLQYTPQTKLVLCDLFLHL